MSRMQSNVARLMALCAVSQFAMTTMAQAAQLLTMKEAMNSVAMIESSAITIESLKYLGYITDEPVLDFSGSYSETGFSSLTTGMVSGKAYSQAYTGVLSGSFGQDITITLTSSGMLGNETFTTSGQMLWSFDQAKQDYEKFEYTETGSINPVWIPLVVAFGIGVASGVAANYVYDWLTSGDVKTPDKPPQNIQQNITINGNNNTFNKNGSNSNLQSSFDNGSTEGTVTAVPEPSLLAMTLAGMGVMGCVSFRRRLRGAGVALAGTEGPGKGLPCPANREFMRTETVVYFGVR